MTRYYLGMTNRDEISALLDRLTRLHAAGRRVGDLNEVQRAALDYLSRANRFSRAPSAVADYLAATRGTVSQTLRSLARKGLVAETASSEDRRVRRYDLTPEGVATLATTAPAARPGLTDAETQDIAEALRNLVRSEIAANGGRSFGLCRTCRHHVSTAEGSHCALLKLALLPEEADQICHEHRAAA
ncbi:MAG: winged helix DNA-binding protein [Paracoccaceae bacterium]